MILTGFNETAEQMRATQPEVMQTLPYVQDMSHMFCLARLIFSYICMYNLVNKFILELKYFRLPISLSPPTALHT